MTTHKPRQRQRAVRGRHSACHPPAHPSPLVIAIALVLRYGTNNHVLALSTPSSHGCMIFPPHPPGLVMCQVSQWPIRSVRMKYQHHHNMHSFPSTLPKSGPPRVHSNHFPCVSLALFQVHKHGHDQRGPLQDFHTLLSWSTCDDNLQSHAPHKSQ